MRESGFKWYKQIDRTQDKIEYIGAFCRPKGKTRWKDVYGKWAKRYYRSTSREIIENAIAKALIPAETIQEIEMKCTDQKLRERSDAPDEATALADPVPKNDPGKDDDKGPYLEDIPETVDGVIEQFEREGK